MVTSKEYRELNRDRLKAYDKKHYEDNKEAKKAYNKKYRENNKGKIYAYYRPFRLKKLYNLSLEDYNTILNSQNGKCAICTEDLDLGKHTHVDHCHKTGRVRGILCGKCNTALGGFRDNRDLLLSAVKYVDKNCTINEDKAIAPPIQG